MTSDNYSYPNTRHGRVNKYSIRGDHHLTGGDTLFARFSWQNTPRTAHRNAGGYGIPGTELHGVNQEFTDLHHGWQTAAGWVNPMGANLVTELNLSLWKFLWLLGRPQEDRDWAQELGYDDAHLHPVYNADGSRGSGGLPGIRPSGYANWSATPEYPIGDEGVSVKYTASWRKGDHYLKFGIEHTRNLDVTHPFFPIYGIGQDQFDGYSTGRIERNDSGSVTGASFGEPWADFMLGLPSLVTGNNLGFDYFFGRFNQSHYNAFVNDDWKLGPTLTLNLGLRWEQPRPPYYEGTPDGRFSTDYYFCGFDYSQGRVDPVQMMPQDFDIAEWQGPEGLAVPFANLPRRGCYEARWSYFAPRFGLAWRMFGNNRTVLRLGAGLTYDQEFGIVRARVMIPARGRLFSIRPRGAEIPNLFPGKRLDLPGQAALGEYQTDFMSELDWQEGQVYSYNLSLQHEIFQGTKLEVGYVGNQGRHLRQLGAFNAALPEGYEVPLIGGGTATLTSDPITAGPRSWISGDTRNRIWSGQRARRPYPQVAPQLISRPLGSSYYNSLQAKLERRFRDGLALSLGYTWSKAMALNFWGGWIDSFGSFECERDRLKAPMAHDRTQTFYNSTIWESALLPQLQRDDPNAFAGLGGHHHHHPDNRGSSQGPVPARPVEPGTAIRIGAGSDRGRQSGRGRTKRRPLVRHQCLRGTNLRQQSLSGGGLLPRSGPPGPGQLGQHASSLRWDSTGGRLSAQKVRLRRGEDRGLSSRLLQHLQPPHFLQAQWGYQWQERRKGHPSGHRPSDPIRLPLLVLRHTCLVVGTPATRLGRASS